MKKTLIGLLGLLFTCGPLLAQGEVDAFRMSQKELSGTARYVSMGGAFGALGGDISVMSNNPAGLAIYRSSEVVTTLGLSMIDTETSWFGTKLSEDKTRFNFNNIAYVGYFPTGNDSGLKGWNIGFAYNRMKDFNRSYIMGSSSQQIPHSISNWLATNANLGRFSGDDLWPTDNYDPWYSKPWTSVLGYTAHLIDSEKQSQVGGFHSPFQSSKDGSPFPIQRAELKMTEKGSIDNYDFSFAFNFSDRVFVGATVTLTDMYYKMSSAYDEDFGSYSASAPYNDGLFLDSYYKTSGTGYGFNLGIIVRPTDQLRLGVAYDSPTWFRLTDEVQSYAGARVYNYFIEDPTNGYNTWDKKIHTPRSNYEYNFRSPDRWIFSAAAILGQKGLISFDYELSSFKQMKFKERYAYDAGTFDPDNQAIKDGYAISHTFKLGGEYKVTPQFAIRAGGMWQTRGVKTDILDGKQEIYTAGTRLNYSLVKDLISYYTFGLGYRFTPNFYVDLACTYNIQKEEVAPFPSLVSDNKILVQGTPGELTMNKTNIFLTLGYKF